MDHYLSKVNKLLGGLRDLKKDPVCRTASFRARLRARESSRCAVIEEAIVLSALGNEAAALARCLSGRH